MTPNHAIIIAQTGGSEVMEWRETALPPLATGEVLIRHTAIGVDFIDVYHRSGLYPVALPSGLGQEAAGIVEAADPATGFKVGERVAYGTGPIGAYSERRAVPASKLVRLPAAISDEAAAAIMLKGLTAWYLLHETYAVKAGDTILVHAAAGGVGSLLCPWAKHLGATVIGTVGSEAKSATATANGCAHVLITGRDDIAQQVRAITGGKGVPVVYDGVGKDTFMASLDSLAPRGLLASFGNASGAVPAFEPGILGPKGSLYLTRPSLFHYVADPATLARASSALFAAVAAGILKVTVNHRHPLREAARAHDELTARRTTGSTILIP